MITAKQETFENVLTSKFEITKFIDFIKEMFYGLTLVAPDHFQKEYSNFSSHIAGYYHIANYTGNDGKKLSIFAIELKKGETLERARSIQRNFVKKLLDNGHLDGAFVAFYTQDEPKWRLSLVRMDYEFAMGKISEKLTPAKRYSYLVGEKEPCHTAKTRLFPLFEPDVSRPSLNDLEDAFSVEKVTDEFFALYCEKYYQLYEILSQSEDFMNESTLRGFTCEQFAKKLMGQIVFLYFIQKKGWLGVNAIPSALNAKRYKDAYYARGTKSRELIPLIYKQLSEDEYKLNVSALEQLSDSDEEILASCVKGRPWGTGPKDFMRQLFKECERKKRNFFDDYLEPLFYQALNVDRGEAAYFPALHCRMPFLNGGLFEQLDNYDWQNNNFSIPNEIFSNVQEKGIDADGILDIFDRYNFTMYEDEPMEREVAIDPEMLGKIFENLLDIKDRKSRGAFYTPREIVHYMCQECLINYLSNRTNIPQEDMRDFVLYGEIMKDADTAKETREGNGEMLIPATIYDQKSGVNRLQEIDHVLETISVADLAVGSGAFPLGMLNEIVRARETISGYLAIGMDDYHKKLMYAIDRHPYTLKTNTIKNCIYAVDIEPSAVDIAKLRLWLSLVIEDEINPDAVDDGGLEIDGHSRPRPLPNLDCNIICGNSLVDEIDGIKLVNESELIGTLGNTAQLDINQQIFQSLIEKLIAAQDKLYSVSNHNEKMELKKTIQSLTDQIVYSQLKNAGAFQSTVEKYEAVKNLSSPPFILWQIVFARVFVYRHGFSIVIGNPPLSLLY